MSAFCLGYRIPEILVIYYILFYDGVSTKAVMQRRIAFTQGSHEKLGGKTAYLTEEIPLGLPQTQTTTTPIRLVQ